MKKRVHLLAHVLVVGFFTLMAIIDFFPTIGMSMSVGTFGFIATIGLAVMTREKGEPVFTSSKQEFRFTIFSGIYLFTLLLVLSLLGGVSQSGIGFYNPILWGLYLLGLLTSYAKYRKELKAQKSVDLGQQS
ncbi:membrane protein [Halalkalibacter wakoensis JCM 9140]|uniref:Membrane protein n=1 Tax=Halalkalibacter wakoensis JCM 9140 TaxID=1236970 RepID=W4Q756_9BACI|nr:hypothetical protein [Halalkalibacter wakoensis]GAE27795.1 membrane protein [Halalkalibacter wakoensis JCM 9140]